MDTCEHCNRRSELYHNEALGMALCEPCDRLADLAGVEAHASHPKPSTHLRQQECLDIGRTTMQDIIDLARDWLGDNSWLNIEDPSDLDEFDAGIIVLNVDRTYEGGWFAFLKTTV